MMRRRFFEEVCLRGKRKQKELLLLKNRKGENMKKRSAVLLAGMLSVSVLIGGCSPAGTEEKSAAGASAAVEKQGKEEEKDHSEDKENGYMEEGIRQAMEAADTLTAGGYFLMSDGSVVTRGKSFENFAGDYAALPGVRKIADSSSEMQLFALTEEGDLYFHQTKILSGVTDVAFSTTNVNQVAVCICGEKIYVVTVHDASDVDPADRSSAPDRYFDVGDKTVFYYENNMRYANLGSEKQERAEGEFVTLGAEKNDMIVVNSEGEIFMDNNWGSSPEYVGMEFFGWKDIVRIDAAKVKGDETELTVAGLQKDGTVLACGTYADEVLSWGKLNDISMDSGLIVGLTPEGTLKVTGSAAEFVKNDIADWTEIVGVKAGNLQGTAVINAVDKSGNFYHLEYDDHWTENNVTKGSLENGCVDGNSWWYRYSPEGTVYRTGQAEGGWTEGED